MIRIVAYLTISLLCSNCVTSFVITEFISSPVPLEFNENTFTTHAGWILEVENRSDTIDFVLESYDGTDETYKKFTIQKINSSTSLLKQNYTFDYEVVADRSGEFKISVAGHSLKEAFSVSLQDVNDNTPQFTNLPATTSLAEDTGVGVTVFTIEGRDLDGTNNYNFVTFEIVGGNDNGYFRLSNAATSTVKVVVNASLDHDLPQHVYNITINATDQRPSVNPIGLWSTSYLVINITDIDDLGASFTSNVFGPVSIAENLSPRSFVTQVTAIDRDKTLNDSITYGILSDSDLSGVFTIDALSGNISLVKTLDRRTKSSYSLLVSATTTYHDPVYALVVIDITDANTHAPTFTSTMYTSEVPENSEDGTLLLVVQATDKDEGNNAKVVYSVEGTDSNIVHITTQDSLGYIYLNASLDYHAKNKYNFTVLATESLTSEKYQARSTVILNITEILSNEHNPIFGQSSYLVNITEEQATGQVIQVEASDSDQGSYGDITYSLIGDSSGKFTIDGNTGWINTTSTLNREEQDSYVLTARASDGDTPARNTDVLVVITVHDINDNSPTFLQPSYTGYVTENSNIDNTILAVQAKDIDIGANAVFEFSLVGANGLFSVTNDGNTGYILVNGSLDYETEREYTFTVEATEVNTLEKNKGTATITINVLDTNDNTPLFSPVTGYYGSIAEGSGTGTQVLTVTATDEDSGSYGDVTYAMVTSGMPFVIDSGTGNISTTAELDYEIKNSYSFTVKAEDGGQPSLVSFTTVVINITDINDNKPIFEQESYNVDIFENTEIGASIIAVTATDSDTGVNSALSYSLQDDKSGLFGIDLNGVISVEGSLDYETTQSYTLLVIAKESSTSEAFEANCTVVINVKDINEFDPVFTKQSYYSLMKEDVTSGSTVLTLTATDADSSYNVVSYSILTGNDGGNFELNKTTGVLSTTTTFDREKTDNFVLKIQAADNGSPSRTTETFVIIDLFDVNDNSPIFSKSQYSTSIPESLPVGTTILTVKATDLDVNSTNSDLRYFLDASVTTFNVTSTGQIFTTNNLDYESRTSYSFTVFAEESSSVEKQRHNATIFITITDVNEYDPVFTQSAYQGNVSEDAPIGSTVTKVEATDNDGDYNMVTYSISHGNDDDMFAINTTTGIITTNALMDYESTGYHTLTVKAEDNGIPARYSEVTVIIDVLDVSDHMPVFTQLTYNATINENTNIGAAVVVVEAVDRDQDVNAEFEYSIVGDNDGHFDISEHGVIFTNATLDYESKSSYKFMVFATETKPSSSFTANATVNIILEDNNEYNPVFSEQQYGFDLPEDSVIGTTVIQLNATDKDGFYNQLSYTVVGGNDNGIFQINVTTGILTTTTMLDREKKSNYILTIRVQDNDLSSVRTSETTVVINVLDISDHEPIFEQNHYNTSVFENTNIGTVLLTVKATDKDQAENGEIHYFIVGDSAKFLVTSHGDIVVNGTLDYETTNSHTIQVVAEETKASTKYNDTAVVTISVLDVNEYNPVFDESKYITIIEDSATQGAQVMKVTATDDDGTYGDITYSIADGNSDGIFTINDTTGWISLTNSLNNDIADQYILTIEAQDNAVNPRSSQVLAIININETSKNATFLVEDNYNITILENALLNTVVLTLNIRDAFDGTISLFSYKIIGDMNDHFSVTTQGEIKVAKKLDYETKQVYNFIVSVTEIQPASGLVANATVTIHIGDVNEFNPVFSQDRYHSNVTDNDPIGTHVIKVSASDQDGYYNHVTYTIIAGDDGNDFTINGTTGDITTATKMDRTQKKQFILTIRASDDGATQRTGEVVVIVDMLDTSDDSNEPPMFLSANYSATILENTLVGTTVLTTETSDKNADLTYSIVGDDGKFAISSDGVIYVNGPLDYETNNEYVFQVVAENTVSGLTSNVSVVITLIDVNEFNPEFNQTVYSVEINEKEAIDTTVVTVFASDQDADLNLITYTIIAGNDDQYYKINNQTGVITLDKQVDRELNNQFILTIRAQDNGVPTRTAEVTVIIGVLDSNDHGPKFTKARYNETISEDASIGTDVLVVQAVDQDISKADLKYEIMNEDYFTIETRYGLGFISVKKELDYELTESHSFHVYAVELTAEKRNTSTLVVISVLDANDHSPVFENTPYNVNIQEAVSIGTSVIQVNASDIDSDVFGPLSFAIIEGDPLGNFTINLSTGLIQTSSVLDYEVQNKFTLVVEVKDGGSPALSETTTVMVNLVNQNEHGPVFIGAPYNDVMVNENTAINSHLLTVEIFDADQGEDGEFELSLVGDEGLFSITQDGNLGYIKVAGSLDYEQDVTHTFYVVAKETKTIEQMETNATITVTVTDVNDNTPVFSKTFYEMTIGELHAPPTLVGQVDATDEDSGIYGVVTYSIVHGDENGNFTINNETGEIFTGAILNREIRDHYSLTIKASDGGVPARTDVTNVGITVTDKNELPPIFDRDGTYEIHVVEEKVYNNDPLLTVHAVDPDLMAITYTIEGPSEFTVESTTGVITVTGSFDHEIIDAYNLTITAVDKGGLNTTQRVSVFVTDINDNSPQFHNTPYITTIADNTSTGMVILTVVATDIDDTHNGEVVYSLLGAEGEFIIGTSSGEISVSGALDRQIKSSYVMTVIATDRGIPKANVNTTTVIVNITDSINTAPKFENVAYIGNINETFANTFVLNVKAIDHDDGTLGEIKYDIIAGNTYDAFKIDAITGEIRSTMALDFENVTQQSFDLTVSAMDSLGLSDKTQVRITVVDINDNAPMVVNIPTPAEVNISNNIPPGTLLFALQAEDLDSGLNGEVEFFILPPSENFTVDPNTGIIQTNTGLSTTSNTSLQVSVVVKDKGAPSQSSVAYILTFNMITPPLDPPFLLPSLTEITIYENTSINNVIGMVNASHSADSFGIVFEAPEPGFFTISKDGSITLVKSLDREITEAYSILVKATKDGQQALGYVTITINDVNDATPKFLFDIYKGQVDEDTNLNDLVLKVEAIDDDNIGTVSYKISSGNDEGVFNISESGEIRIAKYPDYETTTFYNLTVIASDGLQTTSSFVEITILNVNDNPPVFPTNASYNISIPENTLGGTAVLTVKAEDKDGDIIFYSIAGNDGTFTIDSITGVLTTTAIPLDYEKKNSFNLNITAKDAGGLMTSVLVTITITNSNDNEPQFDKTSYNTSVTEGFHGALALNVNASDEDDGSKLTYHIVGTSSLFTIDPITGIINTTDPIDFENIAIVPDENCLGVTVLTIQVEDNGDPVLTDTATVTVYVTDVNDNTPIFEMSSYNQVISILHTGTVLQVHANDADCGKHGAILYSFTSDNASSVFQLNQTTGEITPKISLNTSDGTYVLNVTATNNQSPLQLQSSVLVTITVLLKMNYPPLFGKESYNFSLMEDAEIGENVGKVIASDINEGKAGVFIYSIEDNGYSIPFNIDAETGEIHLVRDLDRESMSNYTLIVMVKDFGEPPLSGTTTVHITINDVNDVIPVFAEASVSYEVAENVAVDSVVCVVNADDTDAGEYGQPIYVIYSGNEGGYFNIDTSTGEIYLQKELDRETTTIFDLVIRAYNYGSYNMSTRKRRQLEATYSEIQVEIKVTDINDNDPVFVQKSYVAGFKDSSSPGTQVVTVLAYDPDKDGNGLVSYSIVGDNNAFSIDPTTGLITTTAGIAQLTNDEVTLTINAQDTPAQGTPRQALEPATVKIYKLPPTPLVTTVGSDLDKDTIIDLLENITGPGYDIIIDNITPDGLLSEVTYYVVKNDGTFMTQNEIINLILKYCEENQDICKKYGINLGGSDGNTSGLYGEDDITVVEAILITFGVFIGLCGIFAILLLCCLRRRKRYMPVYEPNAMLVPSKAVSFDEKPHYFQQDPRNRESQEIEIQMGDENSCSSSDDESKPSDVDNAAIAKVDAYMNHALMNDEDSSTDSDSDVDPGGRHLPPRVDGTSSRSSTEPLVSSYNITSI